MTVQDPSPAPVTTTAGTGTPGAPAADPAKPATPAPADPAAGGNPPAPAEPAPADPKPTDPPAAPKAPEVYDLKLPEGSPLKPEAIEKVATLAKEKGLSNEQAQLVLDARSEAAKEAYASVISEQNEQLKQTTEAWKNQIKGDPEIGGEKFVENIELASRVAKRFGTPALETALETTGLGNNPEFVRLMNRIAPFFKNDTMIFPGVQAPGKLTREQIFYGEDAK